jgi:hypothetical protein
LTEVYLRFEMPILILRTRSRYVQMGREVLRMTPAKAEREKRRLRQSISWLPSPPATHSSSDVTAERSPWNFDDLIPSMGEDEGRGAVALLTASVKFFACPLEFIPLVHDFKRSGFSLISADGGNLATTQELRELSEVRQQRSHRSTDKRTTLN